MSTLAALSGSGMYSRFTSLRLRGRGNEGLEIGKYREYRVETLELYHGIDCQLLLISYRINRKIGCKLGRST